MSLLKIVAILSLAGLIPGMSLAGQSMPERQVLMSRPVTLQSNRVMTKVIRVEFPKGFRTPEHIHKGPGPRYVLQGRIRIIDQTGTRVYGPGEVFWETGDPMVAENVAEGTTILLIFEMAPHKTPERSRGKIVIRPR